MIDEIAEEAERPPLDRLLTLQGLCRTASPRQVGTATLDGNHCPRREEKPMAKRARKSKARKKKKANHGKRPNAR
nr:hypothetical protein [Sinosporangium album]